MEPVIQYGGFWRRFGAYWLDALAWLPVATLSVWLSTETRYFYAWSLVPTALLGLWYHVYLVRRFSGTPGKLLLDLHIRRSDGTSVGYREATLRYVITFVLNTLIAAAFAMAAINMSATEYESLTFLSRAPALTQRAPSWLGPVNIATQVWVWSEFLVLLTNRKRRALHDFVAGTVVVHRRLAYISIHPPEGGGVVLTSSPATPAAGDAERWADKP